MTVSGGSSVEESDGARGRVVFCGAFGVLVGTR